MKYWVSVQNGMEVEADSEEEACEKALKQEILESAEVIAEEVEEE